MKIIIKSLSFISLLFIFSCNYSSKDSIEIVDFDGLYSKIDLSTDKTYDVELNEGVVALFTKV